MSWNHGKRVPHRRMTKPEVYAIVRRAQAGDLEARNELITNNLAWVTAMALKMAHKCNRQDELEDMIQSAIFGANGTGGLVRAIEKFDLSRNLHFSTYASPWIRNGLSGYLRTTASIRGLGAFHRHARISNVASRLTTILERDPTAVEVRAELAKTDSAPPSVIAIQYALDNSFAEVSIDDLSERGDHFDEAQAAALVDTNKATAVLAEAIDKLLSAKEQLIIRSRFGLVRGVDRTLEAIGRDLGLTRERVRQLEARALLKLRRGMVARGFEDLIACP